MTRSNTDRTIERYINGRMGPAERREFLKRAETEPAIQRMLQAEQVIGSAIARDLAAIPILATEPGTDILAKLGAASPAAMAGMEGGAESVAAGSAAGAEGISPLFFGSKLFKSIVAIAGIAGIAIGTFMIAPMLDGSAADRMPQTPVQPATGPAVGSGAPIAPAASSPAAQAAQAAGTEHSGATPALTPGISDTRTGSTTARRAERISPTMRMNTAQSAAPVNPANPTNQANPAAPQQSPSAPTSNVAHHSGNDPAPLEIENNEVKLNIKLQQKKSTTP